MTNRFSPAYFAIFPFFTALLTGSATAGAAMTVCVDEQPHPPYFFADRDGSVQLLEKMAAMRAGEALEFRREPNRRCLEDMRINAIDAVAATSVNSGALAVAVFPHKGLGIGLGIGQGIGQAVDQNRALAVARTVAFRLKDGSAAWNGTSFDHLSTRVLVPPGMLLVTQKMDQLGIAYDDGATDISQIGAKLLAHRAELAIALEYDVAELLRLKEFAGKIEIFPVPFTATEYYLAFSREFYAKHAEQAENIWNAIAATRRSPEFAAALRREGLPALDLPHPTN